MRILVCASEAPLPPLNGFRLQIIPVCAELAARGHEVCVLAYRRPEQHGEPPAEIELRALEFPPRGRIATGLEWIFSRPPYGAILGSGRMAAAARELLAERSFDVAHVAGWPLAGLAPALAPLPTVLTTFDAWHLNYRASGDASRFPLSALYRVEMRRIARFEASAYLDHQAVVVVSAEDQRALLELEPRLPVKVIANGVDARRFAPRPTVAREPGLVVFTGAMHWPPNVAAAQFLAREVLPRLRERRPEARLAIVGRWPSRDVEELAVAGEVEVTGEVPDIGEWLARASAYACPMISGTGIKNKLLEAMACGCACVATPLACQGIDVEDGHELMIGDSAGELAAALDAVLGDDALRSRLGEAAREHVLRNHTWSAVTDAYERLLEAATAVQGSRPAP